MLDEWLRQHTHWLVDPIVRAVGRAGIPPNWITVSGLVANVAVAILIAQGHLRIGGVLTAAASVLDALDGTLARVSGQTSPFGAFLDSTLDRFSEAVIYLGLLFHYAQQGQQTEMILIYATVVGSLMVSYTRARAEGLGLQCKVGLLTRAERVGLLAIGLTAVVMPWMLWLLAVLTNVTVAQRVTHVWLLTQAAERTSPSPSELT